MMLSLRLWRQGPFVRFFVGAGLSVVGNWFNTVAIAVATYRLTGQVASVALAVASSVLPRLLLAPVGGALADRVERRRLLITLDSARALVALLPLLVHDAGNVWLFYVAVALLQAGTSIYNPAQGAYVPGLVPDELLVPANAAFASMRDVGMFVGPALAALVLGLWGPAPAFGANALSFVISAGLLLTLPRAAVGEARVVRLRALLAGYRAIVRRYPRLAGLYLCHLGGVVPIAFFQAIVVVYARELGQPSAFVGVLYAAAGLGGAAGSLAMGQYLRRIPYAAAVGVYVLCVPLLGLLALAGGPASALALLACSTAAGTAGDVIMFVSVQSDVAAAERGRAFGLLFWCIPCGQMAGALLGLTVTARTAVPMLLWVSLGVLPLVAAGALLSIRAARAPAPEPAGSLAGSAG